MERLINRDGTKFVTGERLGSGLLAVVYAAENSATGERVAVKLPAPNLPPDQFRRFEEEHDLLAGLREHTNSVPNAWWGEDEETGRQVLLLEMAPETKLNDLLQEMDGWQREELATKAATQYASLLRELHTLPRPDGENGYTCADRKMGDLRWNVETEQLMVLDWNAVRPKQESGVIEDIHTFAALWYQLLTDRYAGSNLRLLDDTVWKGGQISIGARAILLQALSPRYTDAADLARDIHDWLASIQRSSVHLYQLGTMALSRATAANNAAQTRLNAIRDQKYTTDTEIPKLALDEENDALRYLDIALCKGYDYDEAEEDRGKALNLVQSQGDRLVANVALAFEITRYELAEQSIEWANRTLSQVEQLPTATAKLRLRVKRWQLLFHAGLTAIDETNISLRPVRKALAAAVRRLDEADKQTPHSIETWERVQWDVEQIIRDISREYGSEPVTDLLDLFAVEAQCRILFINAEEDTAGEKYEVAAVSLDKIRQKLAVEIKDDEADPAQEYIAGLRDEDAFTNLDGRISQLHHKARTAVIVQTLIDNVSGDITVPATYIMQRLEDAHYFFAHDLGNLKKIEAHNKLPAILLLAQVDYHQKTGQWHESINDIAKLTQKYPSDEQVRPAVTPFIQNVIRHIEGLRHTPTNDQLAQKMIASLQEIQQIWPSQMLVSQRHSGNIMRRPPANE